MIDWVVPKMWEGGECWIIGGGPSMPREFGVPEDVIQGVLSGELPFSAYSPFLSPIHNKHVIGVNAAFMLGTWVDILFFGDGGFYFANMEAIHEFPKQRISCHANLKKRKDVFGVKFVEVYGKTPVGICQKPNRVAWNLNTGGASISLAYHLGVEKIYLLGFDMQLDENNMQHWHRHYPRNKDPKKVRKGKSLPFYRHLHGFHAIARDAEKLGLEIINVSPNSKIENFKRVKLSDVL